MTEDLVGRVLPVMVFLVAITVVAEIASRAGVFDVAAHGAARVSGRRVWGAWLLFAVLAAVTTTILSLDTTAVLLTPVGITLAGQIGAPPLPFAMTTLWVANCGSLLLPVSNLTNLLAGDRFSALGVGHDGYLALSWRPALVALLVAVGLMALLHRRELRGGYDLDPPPQPHDEVLLRICAVCCLLLVPCFALGLTPAIPAVAAAVVMVVALAVRDPSGLREISVPWLMVLGMCALFAVVGVALDHGLRDALASVAGAGDGPLSLLRLAAVGAGASNVVDNLPAYLALESVADDAPRRLMALLVGVNAGPLVTPWGSLATLLWLSRCRSAGLRVSLGRLAATGVLCATASVVLATLAIALT